MRKAKEYSRGGHRYRLVQLGGYDAAEHATTVLNLAADLLPLILSAKGGLGGLDVSALRLDWGKVRPLLKAFAGSCTLLGKGGSAELGDEAVFDEHFAGDLDGMTELLIRGLELNYASFLEQRLGVNLAELLTKVAPSASPSPTESTGTSGE